MGAARMGLRRLGGREECRAVSCRGTGTEAARRTGQTNGGIAL